jgi:hypothetical protein
MDLQQRKLTKSEWESIEEPVSSDEIEVLKLIMSGYSDVNVKYNKSLSLFRFIKMEYTESIEDYLYNKYFSEKMQQLIKKYNADFIHTNVITIVNVKKADLIRMQKNTVESLENSGIYENVLIDHVEKLLKYKKRDKNEWMYHYFTLYKLRRNKVDQINRHISNIVKQLLKKFEEDVRIDYIIENAMNYIEKNKTLTEYSDMCLYEHQKEIFTAIKNPGPKLVLYIAPTGTGKTLTPIGISNQYKVIFVCAARHVGLALAKAAVSLQKKVAFAFGCSCTEDIRLHYFAAKEYTKNYKSGGIWKVDNTIGDKVEIMICDIKSYEYAMLYMLAFNRSEDVVTYWDEPTITMDYSEHEFHEIIKKNWTINLIPNMVLSSATLPKLHELPETVSSFHLKFPGATVYNIVSHDCKKSIPILNKNGYVVLPHTLYKDYTHILEVVAHCENYLTLLRYFDLEEVVKFIMYLQKTSYIPSNSKIARHFSSLNEITPTNIKLYYLKLLKSIYSGIWGNVYMDMYSSRKRKMESNDSVDSNGVRMKKTASFGPGIESGQSTIQPKSLAGSELIRVQSESVFTLQANYQPSSASSNFGVFVTTKDAYTLTDGPTIFLAADVEKISKFCLQQANIPEKMMTDIMEKIDFNNTVNEKISKIEKDVEDLVEKNMGPESEGKVKKLDRIVESPELHKMKKELEILRSMIKVAKLNETFVPNTSAHLKKWAENMNITNAFTSSIDEETVTKIMLLNDVESIWKILLLMGIGVFTNHKSIDYTEIMKKMAETQRLYMIIASSDYIYGTNYQFCHGYLSKDMELTQEKIIQAMGRIGRNKVQQDYTVRFRDDEQIEKLFSVETEKPEVANMNKLFG